MPHSQGSRDRGARAVDGGETNAGGRHGIENEYFMFDLDEMSILLNEARTEHYVSLHCLSLDRIC